MRNMAPAIGRGIALPAHAAHSALKSTRFLLKRFFLYFFIILFFDFFPRGGAKKADGGAQREESFYTFIFLF